MTNDKQRERLVELIIEGIRTYHTDSKQYLRDSIADYLLANGVIVPPCKVGQTVYCVVDGIAKVMEGRVRAIWILEDGSQKLDTLIKGYFPQRYTPEDFGKTVFLTKEEAEKAVGGVQG